MQFKIQNRSRPKFMKMLFMREIPDVKTDYTENVAKANVIGARGHLNTSLPNVLNRHKALLDAVV